MGSHPYFYLTPYQADVNAALKALRQQEFLAGRYYPAIDEPWDLSFGDSLPALGAQHDSIEAALLDADASGTGSVLDIQGIAATPSFFMASPLTEQTMLALWGTLQPSSAQLVDVLLEGVVEPDDPSFDLEADFWDQIGRGEARYVVLYEAGTPRELFFVGYS